MNISITSRRNQLSDRHKAYIEEKVSKLEKYVHGTSEAHVVLEKGEIGQVVEITFHGLNKTMHGREIGDNIHACVDKVVHKLESQVRKQKEKLTERH